jgi:hypothetical protein
MTAAYSFAVQLFSSKPPPKPRHLDRSAAEWRDPCISPLSLLLPLSVLLHQTQPLGCPILSPPDRAMVGERNPSSRRRCCCCCLCRCLFLAHCSLLIARCWFTNCRRPCTVYLAPSAHKSPVFMPQSAIPKLFFTLLLSKIACQAPKQH